MCVVMGTMKGSMTNLIAGALFTLLALMQLGTLLSML